MSRSRRKNAVLTIPSRNKKPLKRFANKIVRKYKGPISAGKWYTKLYESWNICDWKFRAEKSDPYYRKAKNK